MAVITGTNGGDYLVGTIGNDEIFGLDGNDSIEGSPGVNLIDGGAGNEDGATWFNSSYGVSVDLSDTGPQTVAPGETDTLVGIEFLHGSNYADELWGDDQPNSLFGNGGDDYLDGGDGEDNLNGLRGADEMFGGGDHDNFWMDYYLDEPPGSDSDYADGEGGDDYAFFAGNFADYTIARIDGGYTVASLRGLDTLISIELLVFNDQTWGIWNGTAGADELHGYINDFINGYAGDDIIAGQEGENLIDGGADNDTASYTGATSGVAVDLRITDRQHTYGTGYDTLVNIENLRGSNFEDKLWGDGETNTLEGLGGADELFGNGGDDWLYGGDGNDIIVGGAGTNVIDGGLNDDLVRFSGSRSDYTISVTAGEFNVTGPDTYDLLSNVERANFNGQQVRLLAGTTAGELLSGTAEDDLIFGDAGTDIITGGDGSDELNGESGDDTLSGLDDHPTLGVWDTLTGGSNKDQFLVDAGDVVTDFGVDDDFVRFHTDYSLDRVAIISDGQRVEVRAFSPDFSGYRSIYLKGDRDARSLDAQFFNDVGQGVILTNRDMPTNPFDRLAINAADTRQAVAEKLEGDWGSVLETLQDDLVSDGVEVTFKALARVIAGQVVKAGAFDMAKAILKNTNIVFKAWDTVQFGYELGTYLNDALVERKFATGPNGAEDWTKHADALMPVMLAGVALTGLDSIVTSEVLYQLGKAIMLELMGTMIPDAAAEMERTHQSIIDSLNGAAAGDLGQQSGTIEVDFMVKTPGQTNYSAGDGDDAFVGTRNTSPQFKSESTSAEIGADGDDTFDGGDGTDWISYAYDTLGITADLANGTATGPGIGSDTLISIESLDGGAGADNITGSAVGNQLYGDAGDDIIFGLSGDDALDGGAGADTMVGGLGNDAYVVDSLLDLITELVGEGTDTVQTNQGSRFDFNALYLLPTEVENLTGTSAGAQGVWANSGDNVVTMGGGNDLIVLADGGVDTVNGGAGNDYIYFGGTLTAADQIDGGAGYDTLGLIGSTTLTLTTAMINLERMAVYSAVYFGGGAFDYSITTVDANIGAAGMFVTAASLQATEHLTFDGSAESSGAITVHGGAGDDVISGGGGSDFLIGNGGADILTGNGGADTLLGGAGADTFIYRATSDSTVSARDNISGFATGDHIDLSTIDAITGGANDAFSFIGAAPFSNTAGEVRAVNTSGATWQVQADVNGDGVADLVILVGVGDGQPLGAGSFVL